MSVPLSIMPLGIVALVAMEATPVVLLIAGLFFIFTALTYAEGFLAYASILGLRWRYPHIRRRWKIRFNIPIGGGRSFPITAILGLLFTLSIWSVIIYLQPFTRWVSLAWIWADNLSALPLFLRAEVSLLP